MKATMWLHEEVVAVGGGMLALGTHQGEPVLSVATAHSE